jgi:putative oxidoreductase
MTQVDVALLVLRVAIGVTLALHGINKVKGGLAGTGRWFESMGLKPGIVHAYMAATTEIGSGVLMTLGLLTPLAGAGFVGVMVVAGVVGHRSAGFFVFRRPTEGWEYVMILAVVGAAMGALGAGKYSLDHAFDWTYGSSGLAISAGLGLVGGIAQLVIFWRPPAAK